MADDGEDDRDETAQDPVALAAPRENPLLIGHEAAEATLLASYLSVGCRMPGCSAARAASARRRWRSASRVSVRRQRAADQRLFAATPPTGLDIAADLPVFRRVASGGHPDLLVVERGYDPKRKRLRSEIVVADARSISAFLRLTAGEGGWRIVILDGADAMNRNAANAC